jgi:UDP-GlcNAc:undecaprenyl-phosphate GlcNAc-1-phosphate transferase
VTPTLAQLQMFLPEALAAVGGGLVAAALIALLRPVAQKVGLVDRPNSRKAHAHDVPLVGGLGVFGGFLVSSLLFAPQLDATPFFVAATILVCGGLVDDFFDVRPLTKFAVQAGAVVFVCAGGAMAVQTLGELVPGAGAIRLGAFAVPFTVIAAIGVINAVNFSDGLDGLAGFQLLVAFGALAFLAEHGGAGARGDELLLLIGCVAGFLAFNVRVPGRRQALVFLGDAGAMFLGFAYVWFAIGLSAGSEPVMSPVTALWVLAVPLWDTVTMIVRRLRRGRSPFRPDKEHLHHVFMLAGFSPGATVVIVTGLAMTTAGIGVGGEMLGMPDAVMFAAFLIASGLYLRAMLRAWATLSFLRRPICRRRASRDRRSQIERRTMPGRSPTGVERRSGRDRRCAVRRSADQETEPSTSRYSAGAFTNLS